jgi:hypothetical protein
VSEAKGIKVPMELKIIPNPFDYYFIISLSSPFTLPLTTYHLPLTTTTTTITTTTPLLSPTLSRNTYIPNNSP